MSGGAVAQEDDRLKALEARSSGFAVELLRQRTDHPRFPEVIDKLERIEGPVFRGDVEEAFYQLSKPPW